MTKITRKLLLSIITVVLTVVALGTTTFAWFTLTNTSVVQPFEAEIVADSGIEVAIGDHGTGLSNPTSLNWVTTLTKEAIETYIESVYGSGPLFDHVTTPNGVDFYTLGATAIVGSGSGYLEIPLNFRSDTAQSIEWTTVSMTSPDTQWRADVDFTDASGTPRSAGDLFNVDASNAMRIAMLEVYGTGDHVVAYEKPGTTQNIVLGTGGDLTELVAGDDDGFGNPGAMNYYYEKNNILPFGADSVSTIATVTEINGIRVITMEDVSGSTTEYNAQYFGQVMIRIWLEGWDANTYNAVLSRMITTSFTFTGAGA